MNFQDVIRDVHDESTHTLKTTGSSATIFAVVNTGTAGDSTANIGFATVAISNPTLYAVVNTSAVGIATVVVGNPTVFLGTPTINAVVNLPTSDPTVFIGTPTLNAVVNTPTSIGLNAGVNGIGFATVNVVNQQALVASSAYIGLVTVANTVPVTFSGNVTLDNGSLVGLTAGVNAIGFATVYQANSARTITGNVTLSDSKGFIGLVSVSGFANPMPVTGTFYQATQPVSFSNVTINPSVNSIGFATVAISNPTLYAVVNTGAAGGQASIVLDTGTNNIGSVSVLGGTINSVLQTSTLNVGSVSVLGGGIGLNAGLNGIGFATVNVAGTLPALIASPANIGCVTLLNQPPLTAGLAYIGFATVNLVNQPALVASSAFIGIVTVASTVQLRAAAANIGCVTLLNPGSTLNIGCVTLLNQPALIAGTANIGCVTLLNQPALIAGTANIGCVTVLGGSVLNAGTTKTIVTLPIGFSVASVVTVAVPATNLSIKMTNMVLSSDATVSFRMKSGVTYLTGNASIGVTILPGGGFVLNGSPDSPSWIGLPSGALVIEKFDLTATSAKIAGTVNYFSE